MLGGKHVGGVSIWPPHRVRTATTPARYHRDMALASKTGMSWPLARRVIAMRTMACSHTASVSPPPPGPAVRITRPTSAGLAPSQACHEYPDSMPSVTVLAYVRAAGPDVSGALAVWDLDANSN